MRRKNKLMNLLKGSVFLLGGALLLWNCEKENDLVTPVEQTTTSNTAITKEEALAFINNKVNSKRKASRNIKQDNTVIETSSLQLIPVEKSNTFVPVFEAHKNTNVTSKVFLIKKNGEIKAYLYHTIPLKNSTSQFFSGKIIITTINEEFVNGYRVTNGVFVSRFIKKERVSNASARVDTLKGKDSECVDYGTKFCDSMLDEVVLGGGSGKPPRGNKNNVYVKPPTRNFTFQPTSNTGNSSNQTTNGGGSTTGATKVPLLPESCPDGKYLTMNGCVDLVEDVKKDPCTSLKKLLAPPPPNTTNPNIKGKHKNIRIAVTSLRNKLGSNFEHGFGFYNKNNFPKHGPYGHHVPASEDNHVYFPSEPFQFGTVHTHPNDGTVIPMFSHDDIYSLLKVRDTYVNSGINLLNNNNPLGDNLFVSIMIANQGGYTKTYAIKINNITKLQNLQAIKNNKKKWEVFEDKMTDMYTKHAAGPNGSPTQYQKVFLKLLKDMDLGVDLYEMKQTGKGTPQVKENWEKLTFNPATGKIEKTPCTK